MKIYNKLLEFEQLLKKYDEFGAMDSEPRYHLKMALVHKIERDLVKVPKSAAEWELYCDMKGVNRVAADLSGALSGLLNSFSVNEISHAELLKIRNYFEIF